MVETPAAILNAREIAAVAADPQIHFACLVMGTNDLLKESRARALDGRIAVVPWLAITVLAGRAYGLDVIDGVYNDFKERGRLSRRMRAGPYARHGRQDAHPSIADRALQPGVFAVAGGDRLGAPGHRRVR